MLKAVVFDMDATLLDINLGAFVAVLAKDESKLLADIGRKNPLSMFAAYTAAVYELNRADRDNACTNRELFCATIERRGGVVLADPIIADAIAFFEREVLPHRNDAIIAARPLEGGLEALSCVLDRGLRVALLTNPCFTRECIDCRMGWAGIRDMPFELVTTMENTRRSKPNPDYYRDALEAMGLAPEEVLMVGNDPRRDFPDPDIGLQTVFVGRGAPVRATWCGPMADFASSFDEIEERFYERQDKPLVELVQDVAHAR